LDSHIEVNQDWIEPLLQIIDIINADTFEYTSSPLVRGGFIWGLHFRWDVIPKSMLQTDEDYCPVGFLQ